MEGVREFLRGVYSRLASAGEFLLEEHFLVKSEARAMQRHLRRKLERHGFEVRGVEDKREFIIPKDWHDGSFHLRVKKRNVP